MSYSGERYSYDYGVGDNVLFEDSLAVFEGELTSGLECLKENRINIARLFPRWKRQRAEVISNLTLLARSLHVYHRSNNKAQVAGSSVSLMGGVGGIVGLFSASILAAPLVAVGGTVAAAGGLFCLGHSLYHQGRVKKLVDQADQLVQYDKKLLVELLQLIDEYIERVQILQKKLEEEKELRDLSIGLKTLAASGGFFLRYKSLAKSIKDIRSILSTALNELNFFQKASNVIKTSRVYKYFFGSAATKATASVGAKAVGKRVFLFLGVGIDLISLISAGKELSNDEKPQVAKQFEATIEDLKAESESVCRALESAFKDNDDPICIDESENEEEDIQDDDDPYGLYY